MRYEGGQPLPEKRLHPLSWVFQLVGSLGAVIPIGVAVALGAERGGLFWVVVPLLLLGPLGALWHQWVYRYDFADDGLVIRDGLIFRNLRQIDYRRIENIDTQRNLLHRLLGVADVKVETSSGGGAEAIDFNRDIRPILSGKCFKCHGPDAGARKAKLRLDQRDAAIRLEAIVPGKPQESLLLERVSTGDPDDRMPLKGDPLSSEEIAKLKACIEGGAN